MLHSVQTRFDFHTISHEAASEVGIEDVGTSISSSRTSVKHTITSYPFSGVVMLEP